MRSLLSTERLEDIDGRLAVTDEDPHAPGVRYVKFWVDDAPSNLSENRSQAGEDAPPVSTHHAGIPPFPNLSARDRRTPASPERRERPSQDQGTQDRSYGQGSPDFGGGVGYFSDNMNRGGPIPENARTTPIPRIPEDNVPRGCSLQSMEPNGSVTERT